MLQNCRALLISLLLAFAGFAAAPKTAPAVPHKPATPARTAQHNISDADLERAIRAKLSASKISVDHFQVHVQGGVATLEGQTDVIQHKGTATRLAKTAGAAAVVNKIAVSQAARDKAAGNLAKGRRRAQIKRGETTARSEKRSM